MLVTAVALLPLGLNCKTKCDKEEITFHADLFMP